MKTSAVLFSLSALVSFAASALEVVDVEARQRWPWNGLVDVDFTVRDAPAGDPYVVDMCARAGTGGKKISALTFLTEPIARGGRNRVTWNLGADAPNLSPTNLQLSVTVSPYVESTPLYLVIDLSGGKDAASYPVRYSTVAPEMHVNANDVCKTTELWMRRVRPAGQVFNAGWWHDPSNAKKDSFWAELTKDYYIAIFETTQQQWYQLTGEWIAKFSNETWRATRPVERVRVKDLRGQWQWPDDKTLTATSPLQKLRDRTGLATLDLPTDAQWQFAVYGKPTNSKEVWRYGSSIDEISRYRETCGMSSSSDDDNGLCGPEKGTACVGSYQANDLGLYDMLGNVQEYVVDNYVTAENMRKYYEEVLEQGVTTDAPAVDPVGPTRAWANGVNGWNRHPARGGYYWTESGNLQIWARTVLTQSERFASAGFRLALTCE